MIDINVIKGLVKQLEADNPSEKVKRNTKALIKIRIPQLLKYRYNENKLPDVLSKTLKWIEHIRNLKNGTSIQA